MNILKASGIALLLAATIAGCGARSASLQPYDPSALPSGPLGVSIAFGHTIVTDTRHTMPGYVGARMSCEACHINGGTKAVGGFIGTYARFPQWSERARRVITLQDRLAECFLYSMNGRPPAYTSKAMVALVAYIAWLSRGTRTGAPRPAADTFVEPLPQRTPNRAGGAAVYASRCERCHQQDGDGVAGAFPPLWGAHSFNGGAGMAHIEQITGFVHYNMPPDKPGSLSPGDAYDVAAFVLSHQRPRFQPDTIVTQPPQPAGFF
jgi:thiosulfate dehydrogenase